VRGLWLSLPLSSHSVLLLLSPRCCVYLAEDELRTLCKRLTVVGSRGKDRSSRVLAALLPVHWWCSAWRTSQPAFAQKTHMQGPSTTVYC